VLFFLSTFFSKKKVDEKSEAKTKFLARRMQEQQGRQKRTLDSRLSQREAFGPRDDKNKNTLVFTKVFSLSVKFPPRPDFVSELRRTGRLNIMFIK